MVKVSDENVPLTLGKTVPPKGSVIRSNPSGNGHFSTFDTASLIPKRKPKKNPSVTSYYGTVSPVAVVEFEEGVLSPKELSHARITARTNYKQLMRIAYLMKKTGCSYTQAFNKVR